MNVNYLHVLWRRTLKKGIKQNIEFAFWNKFLTELYSILRDWLLHLSDWLLHLSTLECALPLFFCYNRTNYARWGSLYYEDCFKLPTKFPEIYEEFQRRSFVVNFKKTCASAVPMDQSFNKPGKGQGGIIVLHVAI